jgi:hypothetical protein
MPAALIELHFLPSLEYFCALEPFENIFLERKENFNKQSFRNRCFILASHGPVRLTVPLVAKSGKVLITDVKIDYSTRWTMNFWRTLESAYANAPFFEHYADPLHKEIFSGYRYLYELNFHLLSLCLQWLKWNKGISESVTYAKNISPGIMDLRGRISAKNDFRHREYYTVQPYRQVFGSNFVPNLSLLDLVFCEGPHAAALIEASCRKN